jgi:cobalt-zinc-cadmium efflux system protein
MPHKHTHTITSPGEHAHRLARNRNALILSLVITVVFFVVELIGSILTNSLALLADSGHLLSDAFSLGLSLFATVIAGRQTNPRKTFGYYRAEILAAFLNGGILLALTVLIAITAIRRLAAPPAVEGTGMLVIAALGLVANGLSALALYRGADFRSLNIRGALMHIFADGAASVGAVIAALAIVLTGNPIFDPVVSLVLAALVAYSAWDLVRDSTHVLMEGTPAHLNVHDIETAIRKVPGVRRLHDTHLWTLTSGLENFTTHAIIGKSTTERAALVAIKQLLLKRYGIAHSTVQVEREKFREKRTAI